MFWQSHVKCYQIVVFMTFLMANEVKRLFIGLWVNNISSFNLMPIYVFFPFFNLSFFLFLYGGYSSIPSINPLAAFVANIFSYLMFFSFHPFL